MCIYEIKIFTNQKKKCSVVSVKRCKNNDARVKKIKVIDMT